MDIRLCEEYRELLKKASDAVKLSSADQAAMKIVDMCSSNYCMMLVDAQATLQTIEPELQVCKLFPNHALVSFQFKGRYNDISNF